jgi:hypothetical protein
MTAENAMSIPENINGHWRIFIQMLQKKHKLKKSINITAIKNYMKHV